MADKPLPDPEKWAIENLVPTTPDAADAVLRELFGDQYDPNWRNHVSSPPPSLARVLELTEANRKSRTPFLRTAFRIQDSPTPTTHLRGGQMHSPQAKCGLCKAPLVLFADFDATDQQLRGDHGLSRLPLLYCCSCPGPVHYLVSNSGDVTTIPSEEQYIGDLLGDDFIDEECPFTDRPKVIPKGYLTLIEISAELDRLIVPALTTEGFAALTPSDKQKLAALLGREPVGRWEMYFSQIGGYPNSYQGDEGKPDVCPNPECPLRLKRGQEFQYRPLAVLDLWDDEFWGLDKDALQIVYHICPGCMCISAQYTCT